MQVARINGRRNDEMYGCVSVIIETIRESTLIAKTTSSTMLCTLSTFVGSFHHLLYFVAEEVNDAKYFYPAREERTHGRKL